MFQSVPAICVHVQFPYSLCPLVICAIINSSNNLTHKRFVLSLKLLTFSLINERMASPRYWIQYNTIQYSVKLKINYKLKIRQYNWNRTLKQKNPINVILSHSYFLFSRYTMQCNTLYFNFYLWRSLLP